MKYKDFENYRDRLIHVPVDLILYKGSEKRILSVFVAVVCKANYADNGKKITKLSLQDIIYTMGLTPKRGKGGINEQVAIAVSKLKELGFFKCAPDYLTQNRIDAKSKYRYEVVKPKEAKTYMAITPFEVFMVAGIARNKSNVDSNGNKRRITFSYETMLRAILLIRMKIMEGKGNVLMITRDSLHKLVGVSPQTITDITNELDKAKIIRKRVYDLYRNKTCADGSIKREKWQVAFYSNYYNTTEKDVYDAFNDYEVSIGYENPKLADQGDSA